MCTQSILKSGSNFRPIPSALRLAVIRPAPTTTLLHGRPTDRGKRTWLLSKRDRRASVAWSSSRRVFDAGWKLVPIRAKEFVVDRIARGETDRRPSQKLPSTAIYCDFGAAKPLRSLQPFHSFLRRRVPDSAMRLLMQLCGTAVATDPCVP
jgi:hypothetical protein